MELYFRLHLTETEHCIVEEAIQNQLNKTGDRLVYYRQMKNGHIPMVRECKVEVNHSGPFMYFLHEKELSIAENIIPNK